MATSPAQMELSILKLASPRRRSVHSARFTFDKDLALAQLYGGGGGGGSVPSSPPWAPPSSRRLVEDDDLFTIFEQHRAAVPFKWEETPGTRRHDAAAAAAARAGAQRLKEAIASSTSPSDSSSISRSSSGGTTDSSRDVEEDDDSSLELKFKFDPFEPFASNPRKSPALGGSERMTSSSSGKSSSGSSVTSARRTRSKRGGNTTRRIAASPNNLSSSISGSSTSSGKSSIYGMGAMTLPLKPPPGLNSIKHLLNLEHDDRPGSGCVFGSSGPSILSSPRTHARRSFRRDGLKALPFLSSAPLSRTSHGEDLVLGFEEWPKVVQQQNKLEKKEKQQEKQQKGQEKEEDVEPGRHITSRGSRLSFSFRKKSASGISQDVAAAAAALSDPLDADAVFGEDFGKKGGLHERRPLQSISSRGLADGYANFRSRSWVYDSDAEYSDGESAETARTSSCTDADHYVISEVHVDDYELKQNTKDVGMSIHSRHIGSPKESKPKKSKKRSSRNPLARLFGSSGKDKKAGAHQKPSRLSAVSPAPPPTPPAASAPQSETKSKPVMKKPQPQRRGSSPTKSTRTSSNPLLRLCMSGPIGKVLFRNVKQLRTFDFHQPRVLTAK